MRHDPVLLAEVIAILRPEQGDTVLDATLGLGGHAEALCGKIGREGAFIGIETDEENRLVAEERLRNCSARITCLHANFRDVASLGLPQCNIIVADLGLSSPHVDDASRGFTFRADAPLDLRFDRTAGAPASAMIAEMEEEDLARVLRGFGELPMAMRLAKTIKLHGAATTADLRSAAEDTYGYRAKSRLPQLFQALRIAVNDEMGSLEAFLREVPALLAPGGRFGVISYHSLEDRMVKRRFRELCAPEIDERTGAERTPACFSLLTRKAVVPSQEEMERNPRSRSAKFRAILRSGSVCYTP